MVKLLFVFFVLKQKFTEQIQAKNTHELSQVLGLRVWFGLVWSRSRKATQLASFMGLKVRRVFERVVWRLV